MSALFNEHQPLKVCLDAGHGGRDSGAINEKYDVKESILAMQIVNTLREILLLSNRFQYKVKLTRSDIYTYPSLTERCTTANKFGADIFISIHLNSATNKSAKGIETLIYDKASKTARTLATNVQHQLIKRMDWKNRGVKERDNLTVLKKTRMPAILVECGFISNDEECLYLQEPTVQWNIADAIARGIADTFISPS